MKKDIFIDNNIASRFGNPMDKEYKKLVQWLVKKHENEEDDAYLVVSQKLIGEYDRSNINPSSQTAIPILVTKLLRDGRLNQISNQDIKTFKAAFFTKKVVKKLLSNNEDREHIPIILLSDRKMALAIDINFRRDLMNFPGFKVIVSSRPEEINYE